jgi:flagellar FliJ protein
VRAYRFRLAGVARVRAVQERVAAQQLAVANRDLHHAREARRCAAVALDRLAWPAGPTTPAALQWTADQSDRLASTLRRRTDEAETAEVIAGDAARAWTSARQRGAALERLEVRQRAEWRAEADRLEAGELDELTLARFAREEG